MADEEKQPEEAVEQEGGEEKGGSNKLLIIILLAVILIGGAGVGAFLFISGGSEEEAAATADGAAPAAEAAEAAPAVGPDGQPLSPADAIQAYFFEVPELLVNLSSSGSANRYLKMKVNLELGSEADLAAIEKLMPRIVNDFQLYLRQLRVEDLQGAAGVYRLREALLLRANQAAQPLEINDVLFKEILVQ